MSTDKNIKLNLGCYDKHLPGFINVDIREECNPDVVDDAFTLKTFKENSVDLIYCSHMLEHLGKEDSLKALNRWFKLLKPRGILRLAVPDIEAVCKRYIYNGDLRELSALLYGSQRHPFDFHYNGWDFKTLKEDLLNTGFDEVSRWNWWEVDHGYCDDFSQAYIPARDRDIKLSHNRLEKGNGILVSLNVEAKKTA